jgi:hypothetical protein
LTTGKQNKKINIDAETSRDFLMTEDFNDSGNERPDTDGNNMQMTSGKEEDESEYLDQYGEESCSSDDSVSNISNPFREYQEMLGE